MTRPSDLKIDPTERFPHLAGAPIVEAIIHWQARARNELQQEPLQKELKGRLPGYPTMNLMRRYSWEATFQEDGSTTQTQRGDWEGYRLESVDKLYVAQFKRDGLVFSRLQPYENWDQFSVEALQVWKIYIEVAAPAEVERLGVRFINRLSPIAVENLGELLQSPPRRLKALGFPVTNFLYQSSHDVPGHSYRVNVIDTIEQPKTPQPGGPSLIMDIDAFTTRSFTLDDSILAEHLAQLRWLKNKVFFSLLTHESIKRFQKERA